MKQKKDNLKDIKKRITELERENEEYLNSWKRETANLINYKHKELERTEALIISCKEHMLENIIPVLDNIYLAEKSINEELKNDPSIKGFLFIKTQLQDYLKSQGLKEIECMGKMFNPREHEVIEEVKEKGASGEVVEVLENGYILYEKVIRPAKVKIIK